MPDNIFIFPFVRKGVDTIVFSQLVSLEKNTHVFLKGQTLYAFAQKTGVHPSSVGRKLLALPETPFFSVEKKDGGYFIQRSNKDAFYKGVLIDLSLLETFSLTSSESVLFSAVLYLHLSHKLIPPRGKLAAMTGFSLRQVAYALQSLTQKGLLTSSLQTESYVRHTQEEGRVEDTRDRRVPTVNFHKTPLLKLCKIAPLKESLDNPVNTNGFIKSDCQDVIKFFSNIMEQGTLSVQTFKKALTKNPHITSQELKQALQKVLETPFLKKALQFGWQEAVVECYQQKKAKIWEKSKHIASYTGKKLGLMWILKNIKKILSGYFDSRHLSETAQKEWTERQGEGAKTSNPEQTHRRLTLEQMEEEFKRKIRGTRNYTEEERGSRITLLEKLGAGIYKAWIERAQLRFTNGHISLVGSNRFVQDRLDTLLLNVS